MNFFATFFENLLSNPDFIGVFNDIASLIALNLALGFYLITTLQWFGYKLVRVGLHFTRFSWHIYFAFAPWFVYIVLGRFFLIYAALFWLPFLYLWHKKLDKKLVWTKKVWVFAAFLGLFTAIFAFLGVKFAFRANILPLICALLALKIFDLAQKRYYLGLARRKIASIPQLIVILITASYGKTSIKNFLFECLRRDFTAYKSPRSVNTLLGIAADINGELPQNAQIYIAEAGARERGDILDITRLLNPQICIVGEIGQAHLEYFKSEQNIRATKLEALQSGRLQRAFCHSSTLQNASENYEIYDKALKSVNASLDGLEFELEIAGQNEKFSANLLGGFNAENLCAAVLCAHFLGVSLSTLKSAAAQMPSVEHRLQIISKSPKFIIDDGFNGNFKGMSASYRLCAAYKGRRVLVTPGIVEVSEQQNAELAGIINECFDLVIIIGELNSRVLSANLSVEKIVLRDKALLVQTLAERTQAGDLILFSNDTPSFM